jgi:DNA-binding CsgD family transcriptional regulator
VLHGRDVERAHLVALVDGARRARAGSLVLHGEPGVGKTALLDDLAAASTDVLVLRAQGQESETPLAYAALHRLVRPLLAALDRIPAPQAHALGVAFGLADGDRVDPFLVAVATLSVLTAAAEERPVLAVVDDAHWLDAASADALLFTARRLHADRVVMLFSVRDGAATPFRHDGVPSLAVGDLDRASAKVVIEERAGVTAPPVVVDRLFAHSGGNALALVELTRVLSAAQLTGDAPLPAALPVTADMERVFLDRVRRLPDEAQRFLLMAAADDSGLIGAEHLAAAEASGLVVRDGDALRFRHPLVRSAIYQAATDGERRDAHRALAAALEGQGAPDRQVWHAAAATQGHDDALAAALQSAGERGEARGGHLSASELYERAAELTTDPELRATRRLAAARTAWGAGDVSRTAALISVARQEARGPVLRADIDRLRGRIEVNVGSASVAHRIYVSAARTAAVPAPDRALDLAVAAAGLAAYGGDSGLVLDPALITDHGPDVDGRRGRSLHHVLRAMTAASEGTWAEAVDNLHDAAEDGLADAPPDVLAHIGQAALHLGDDRAAGLSFTTMLDGARETSAGTTVLYALPRLAFALFLSGEWSAARRCADEARALSSSVGQRALSATPLAWLALLDALRGAEIDPGLRADLDDLVESGPLGILAGPTRDLRRWADGVRAAQGGAAETALHHLGQMQLPALTRMAAIDRIDAAVRAGRPDQATAWVDELAPFAGGTRWPWALGAVDHGRALIADGASASRLFESSLAHYENARRPFDLARTHLAYGEHLRRDHQRVDARPHLRRALEIFDDLRAEPLSARTARELRASGETARKRDVSTLVHLTPMELQVAQLVSRGMSNKEVAAQCWVSPRTVAFHLRNCFVKTGVASRGELAQLALN